MGSGSRNHFSFWKSEKCKVLRGRERNTISSNKPTTRRKMSSAKMSFSKMSETTTEIVDKLYQQGRLSWGEYQMSFHASANFSEQCRSDPGFRIALVGSARYEEAVYEAYRRQGMNRQMTQIVLKKITALYREERGGSLSLSLVPPGVSGGFVTPAVPQEPCSPFPPAAFLLQRAVGPAGSVPACDAGGALSDRELDFLLYSVFFNPTQEEILSVLLDE